MATQRAYPTANFREPILGDNAIRNANVREEAISAAAIIAVLIIAVAALLSFAAAHYDRFFRNSETVAWGGPNDQVDTNTNTDPNRTTGEANTETNTNPEANQPNIGIERPAPTPTPAA